MCLYTRPIALARVVAAICLVSAQQPLAMAAPFLERYNLQAEVTVAGWFTQGETRWDHNASALSPLVGSPTSELRYKDENTNVVELGAQVTLRKRIYLRANYGFGAIGSGQLTDDDYVSAAGATFFGTSTPGAQRISRTHSDLNDDHLWYVTVDLGYAFLDFPGDRGVLKGFVGYQHWTEKLEATGVAQVECTAPGTFCNPVGTMTNSGQLVITNIATWHSLRVGLEADYLFFSRARIDGKVAFIPYSSLKNEDIHHLRTDLRQDPSFGMSGTGLGVNAEGTVSLRLIHELSLNLGYRVWWMRVTDGEWQSHPLAAPTVSANLNEFQTLRHGVTVGLSYRF